ncbi:acetyltransferase [Desulfosporosinus acidiphilus SJ4]|uniref:Acetyltransferase n=1 Tax=Desulfosporosinus acidiphilus (strain DSM 22704 / JCM 16185 / SJ4) TaxID=646529 RepID=I4D5J3_DESAJ|nr:GNAT family N-acetyltransferase [Desulfosporosinus acidiphilus]AFM41067.1 acetyltransferase [Desulfosporosinus acidiphilus SJ4]
MIIREMIAEDIPQLARLYKQFWNEESSVEAMHKQFNKLQKNRSHILVSAIQNKALIGSVMGVICEELYGDCKPFLVLENMIVDKTYRNQGVGKALVSELEKIATKRNCTQVILVTESNRIDACKFYESAGYSSQTHKGFKKKLK